MKRIVKDPDVRRAEIIAAAGSLFEKLGYENTSVEAIIKEAGIAKGTFYYYFKAKKDILEALVEQVSTEIETHFHSILAGKKTSAIQKLKQMLKGPEKKKIVSSPVMQIIHKPENRELQEKLNRQSVKMVAPLLAKVLKEGKEEGVFTLLPSLESIQLILAGSEFILSSGLFDLSPKEREAYLKAAQNIFELLVGVKSGTLRFISKE